jgi:ArsR family transcriptional regulator
MSRVICRPKTALCKPVPALPENPAVALASAAKLLKPDGQILLLDLLKHSFEDARKLYGDCWLEAAGFKKIEISIVAAEEQPPHFQTILAGAEKS